MVNFRHLKKGNTIGNFHDFKPKKSTFWPFLLEKLSKIHIIGDFGFWLQKSSKFEENSKTYNYSSVPQIDHPVALCYVLLKRGVFNAFDCWMPIFNKKYSWWASRKSLKLCLRFFTESFPCMNFLLKIAMFCVKCWCCNVNRKKLTPLICATLTVAHLLRRLMSPYM